MANQRIATPRFYVDYINYQMSRGKAQNGNFDVITGTHLIDTFTKGSEPELFDMRPSNLNEWDTSVDTGGDHVLVNIDLGNSNLKTGFVAILNHNLDSANGKFRIAGSNTESHIQSVDMISATAQPTCTEVVNGTVGVTQNIITPALDGSTIVRFSEESIRYWGIQFEGNPSFSPTTKLNVGCILIGEYWEAPHSPDLSIKRMIAFDGVTIQQSLGGQKYSNMTQHGRSVSTKSKSPFSTTTSNQQVFGGRMLYDMEFSYLDATDVLPDEYHTYQPSDDSFVGDVWNRTNGNHLPFILSLDKDSEGADAESEHLFARFGSSSLNISQVAYNVYNIKLRIEEEF